MYVILRRFFDPDDVGRPQFLAGGLLLVYLLQCVWLVHVQTERADVPDSDQALRTYQGLQQWKGGPIAGTPASLRAEAATGLPSAARAGHLRVRDGFDEDRSPLYYLIAAAPAVLRPGAWLKEFLQPVLAASPYLFFGGMLGASLWYVTRRLYGNAGGFIALGLYCFSPGMILNAGWRSLGELGGVWGAFGCVFTAIAVAHTLYAPREVILWNARRILLLGLSLALAAGHQFSLGIFALIILPLMLWVAPVRPRAVTAIWITALAVGVTLLFASYFFEPHLFWQGIIHARWIDFEPRALLIAAAYRNAAQTLVMNSPPLVFLMPAALVTYVAWKRARYFGNTAPLLVAVLMLVLAMGAPAFPGQGFHLAALVFLFVFVSGVFADLLETQSRTLVIAGLTGLVGTAATWNLLQLWRL